MIKIILIFSLIILPIFSFTQNENIIKNYYNNGNIKEIQSFKDDKLHGTFLTFSIEGVKTAEATYLDGLKHSNWRIWSDDGVLLFDMFYDNGKRVGVWKMYDQYGDLLSYKEY